MHWHENVWCASWMASAVLCASTCAQSICLALADEAPLSTTPSVCITPRVVHIA